MSSNTNNSQYRPAYAPRYGGGGWREREAMKEKQRKELEQRRKEEARQAQLAKTEDNFPALSMGVGGATQSVKVGEDSFADKAAEWQVKDDIADIREKARQQREEDAQKREQMMRNGIYIMSRAPVLERPLALPVVEEEKKREPLIDRDDFVIVKKKVRKEKRELTEAELAAKHSRQLDEQEDDTELNGDLMETGYRRDHY
jgi:hypothetical protein